MTKKVLIEGMKCEGCADGVKEKFGALQGVESVQVDLAQKQVTLEAVREIALEELKTALADTKFQIKSEA